MKKCYSITMDQNTLKQRAAKAALEYIQGPILGVGTGSTVNCLIDLLPQIKNRIEGAIASSEETARRLKAHGIAVLDPNGIDALPLYIDGADEVDPQRRMIKGGGGALTREKILATFAKTFICLVDETKFVPYLGKFPVAVEVIPCARHFVALEILNHLKGKPTLRRDFTTDNGQVILDVTQLDLQEPYRTEERLKMITGVVESGIFGKRIADFVLIAKKDGMMQLGKI